jgi:hypothetical protein
MLPEHYKVGLKKALKIRNGKMTDRNCLETALCGSNTAAYLLSSGTASKVALFYILDYIVKDPVERESTLSLAARAKKDIDKYPSLAEDSGQVERTAKHLLANMMNKFNGCGEYSLALVSSALLGLPAEPMTHVTKCINVNALQDYAFSRLSDDMYEQDTSNYYKEDINLKKNTSEYDSDDYDNHLDNENNTKKKYTNTKRDDIQEGSEGTINIELIGNKTVTIDWGEAYAFRSLRLQNYSAYEFKGSVKIMLKDEKKKKDYDTDSNSDNENDKHENKSNKEKK